jgi:sulfite reductase (NADPH) flavoprotein alpha-component
MAQAPDKPIAILFGSESGNAEGAAGQVRDFLSKAGHESRVIDMQDVEGEKLIEEALVLIVTSTYGNGDPPFNAMDLHDYIDRDDVDLCGLRFAVCALGDSTYTHFARCGREFDQFLGARGATRIFDRVEIDGHDFLDAKVKEFSESVISYLSANSGS